MIANEWLSADWVSPPGETIKDLIEERQIPHSKLKDALGLSSDEIQSLLEGERPITIGLAQQLQVILGPSVSFWISRDERYHSEKKRLHEQTQNWAEQIPVSEMIRFGWFDNTNIRKIDSKILLEYFGVSSVRAWYELYQRKTNQVRFRSSNSFKADFAATAAWLRQGEREALKMECGSWDRSSFRDSLQSIRELTRKKDPDKFIPMLQSTCAAHGVAVVIVRSPSGCTASGSTMFLSPQRAMILLSFRYKSDDHFWFTFFHEAGHLYLHGENMQFVESDESSQRNSETEVEANRFATEVLIPNEFRTEFNSLRPTYSSVVRFAQRIGISPGIIVGQLQHSKRLPYSWLNGLKRRYVWADEKSTDES